MSKITLQHIFNLAWQKFIIEDALPAVEKGRVFQLFICAYLTEDGRKCGVGLALPENHPTQGYSGPFSDLYYEYIDLFDIPQQHLELGITKFQFLLHDDLIDKEKGVWLLPVQTREFVYRGVAQFYGLTIPERK